MTRESYPGNNEDNRDPTRLAKLAKRAGAAALALSAAVSVTYVTRELGNGGELDLDRPMQVESVQLDQAQRQQLDTAAAERAAWLLDPASRQPDLLSPRQLTDSEASIREGNLVVSAHEVIGSRRAGALQGTIDSEIIFEGAPVTTDPAAVREYLDSGPHMEHVALDRGLGVYMFGATNRYVLSVDIEDNFATVTPPQDVGPDGQRYTSDVPLSDYYEASTLERAALVTNGQTGSIMLG